MSAKTSLDNLSYDELLSRIPMGLRPQVARARNARERTALHQTEMLRHSAELKGALTRLYTNGLTYAEIARLMDLSQSRIREIIQRPT